MMNKNNEEQFFLTNFATKTGLSDAVFLPHTVTKYFFLLGTQKNADDPIKDALEDHEELANTIRTYLCKNLKVPIWVNAMVSEAKRIMGTDKLLDATTKGGSSSSSSIKDRLKEVMWDDEFIRCFSTEPRFNVPWALILVIYVILYADDNTKIVEMFQKACECFGYRFSSDTVESLDAWSTGRDAVPVSFLRHFCVHIIRGFLLESEEKFTDSK